MLLVELHGDDMVHAVVQHEAVKVMPPLAAVKEGAAEGKLFGQVVAQFLGEMVQGEMNEEAALATG